jgi:hypothetical protein
MHGQEARAIYTTHHTIVQEGYISMLQLTPKQDWEQLGDVVVINFYGATSLEVARKYRQAWEGYDGWLGTDTDTLWKRKQFQVYLLRQTSAQLSNTNTIIFGGDLNFVLEQQDRSGTLGNIPLPFLTEWEAFCSQLHLTEVYQPSHTYFVIREDEDNYQSSRLDRWYINTSPTKQTEVIPQAYIPHIPYSITTTYHNERILLSLQDTNKEKVARDFGNSNIHPHDHLPVCLDIYKRPRAWGKRICPGGCSASKASVRSWRKAGITTRGKKSM